jgi:hypothetical protein
MVLVLNGNNLIPFPYGIYHYDRPNILPPLLYNEIALRKQEFFKALTSPLCNLDQINKLVSGKEEE